MLQQREEVDLDRRRRRRARDGADRRRAAVGRRLLAPQRDLLQPHQIGLGGLDLLRQRNHPLGELRALELVPDGAGTVDRLSDRRRADRRRQVRAQEQVAGHDGHRRRARRVRSGGDRERRGERQDEQDRAFHWTPFHSGQGAFWPVPGGRVQFTRSMTDDVYSGRAECAGWPCVRRRSFISASWRCCRPATSSRRMRCS